MIRIYFIFLSVMITVCASAQERKSLQTVINYKSELIGDLDTIPWLQNPPDLYQTIGYMPFWTNTYRELNFPAISNMENFSRLTGEGLLLKSTSANLRWNILAISGFGIKDLYNPKWTYLNLSPRFVTRRNYYDLLSKNPWSIYADPWIYDTFWTALLRNSYLFINHRQ